MSVNTEFVVSVHITEIVLRMQKVFCFENGTLNVKGKPEYEHIALKKKSDMLTAMRNEKIFFLFNTV